MTRKIYRTAQANNARGDLVDSQNRPIDSRAQQVSKQYRKQTSNVTDSSVIKKKSTAESVAKVSPAAATSPAIESLPAETTSSGLAAAIARARQVKQEPLKPPQDNTNQIPGISKI